MSMWREWPEYPDSRTTFKALKNSYTGKTYCKIYGQSVVLFCFVFYLFFLIFVWTCWNFHSTSIKVNHYLEGYLLSDFDNSPFSKIIYEMFSQLTGGNWQKWKRVFLTCPCHKIYRDEAVGLKSCKNTWKFTIFVKMWNLGQYRENLIFCQ